MKTEKIEMTPDEAKMIAQAIAVKCADNTDFYNNSLLLDNYCIELEEVTYDIDCSITVHYPDPSNQRFDEPPFDEGAYACYITWFYVTKCYPDYSLKMETDKSGIERLICDYITN